MPLAMTLKFTIIESTHHIRLLLVMLLCMFPGRDGHLWGQLGSLRQPGTQGCSAGGTGSWGLHVNEFNL